MNNNNKRLFLLRPRFRSTVTDHGEGKKHELCRCATVKELVFGHVTTNATQDE